MYAFKTNWSAITRLSQGIGGDMGTVRNVPPPAEFAQELKPKRATMSLRVYGCQRLTSGNKPDGDFKKKQPSWLLLFFRTCPDRITR